MQQKKQLANMLGAQAAGLSSRAQRASGNCNGRSGFAELVPRQEHQGEAQLEQVISWSRVARGVLRIACGVGASPRETHGTAGWRSGSTGPPGGLPATASGSADLGGAAAGASARPTLISPPLPMRALRVVARTMSQWARVTRVVELAYLDMVMALLFRETPVQWCRRHPPPSPDPPALSLG